MVSRTAPDAFDVWADIALRFTISETPFEMKDQRGYHAGSTPFSQGFFHGA
jgi:hypothetical protein